MAKTMLLLYLSTLCHIAVARKIRNSTHFPNFLRRSTKKPPAFYEDGNIWHSETLAQKSNVRIVRNGTDMMREFTNATGYDRNVHPTQSLGYPTNVSITMYIEGLLTFSAETMDFQVDIYFQQIWIDHRLRHGNKKKLLIKEKLQFDKIWHPDLYFANAREAAFHHVMAPNFLVWIHPNGTVYYDARVSLKVMCMMDLSKYPLDSQRCHIRILSYAYDKEQLIIHWMDDRPITRNHEIKLASMRIVSITSDYCSAVYDGVGEWSCTKVTFLVRREMMHHILQHYIPTAMLVMISWSSFWLDVDSVPGRVTLCITTLLTLATQAQSARQSLPQVSYIKAIDVWMHCCLAFGFGVMIEFTFVNYLSRRRLHQLVNNEGLLLLLGPNAGRRPSTINPLNTDMPAKSNTIQSDAAVTNKSDLLMPTMPSPRSKSWTKVQGAVHRRQFSQRGSLNITAEAGIVQRGTLNTEATATAAAKAAAKLAEHVSITVSAPSPEISPAPSSTVARIAPAITKAQLLPSDANCCSMYDIVTSTVPASTSAACNNYKLVLDKTSDSLLTKLKSRLRAVKIRPPAEGSADDRRRHRQYYRKMAQKIDQYCRRIFPIAFVLFNLIYWPYYVWIIPDFKNA